MHICIHAYIHTRESSWNGSEVASIVSESDPMVPAQLLSQTLLQARTLVCMCVCMCMYVYMYVRTCNYVHVHVYVYADRERQSDQD